MNTEAQRAFSRLMREHNIPPESDDAIEVCLALVEHATAERKRIHNEAIDAIADRQM